ncbi:cytochrome p450 3a17 [Apiospora arundinis]
MYILGVLNPSSLSVGSFVAFFLGTIAIYRLVLIVYRVFFHPLAKFPGPKLYAATYFPYLYQNAIRGTFAKDLLQLHLKYGPIVRVSPDRLHLDGTVGYPDVYSRRHDQEEYAKIPETYGFGKHIGIMVAEKEDHRRQRRLLSHAFSEAALTEQESYIKCYVDLLITRLKEQAETSAPVDMLMWYNFTTFDIIGELAFADPFNSLENSDYHPWVLNTFSTVRSSRQMMFFHHYKYLKPFFMTRSMKQDAKNRAASFQLGAHRAEKRLALQDDSRRDFMTYILRHNGEGDEKGMTHEELLINARSLIVAGSESPSTVLSGFTFYLPQNPKAYKTVCDEIRTSFSSEDEINLKSTAGLPYLHACIEETMRIYSPAPTIPARSSPGAMLDGKFVPKGTIICMSNWATHRNPRNFRDPDVFAPERWLPVTHPLYNPRYASDNRSGFRPFSSGPRDCVGKNLANGEMRLIIARLLWNFDISLVEGQEDWAAKQRVFDVYEKGPLMVRLRRRYVG